jgi:hypothetical protein
LNAYLPSARNAKKECPSRKKYIHHGPACKNKWQLILVEF